jgi:hypothetical protein
VKISFFLAVILAFNFAVNACAQEASLPSVPGIEDIHPCHNAHIGVDLLCDQNWKQDIAPQVVMMIISADPAVLLTVAKAKEPVTGIEELTQDKIQALGGYAEGFKTQLLQVDGHQALRVEGFAKEFPEMRLLDFYVIRDYTLYSFLFSVNPKEEWDHYSVLFEKIAQSIKIPDRKP